MPTYRQANRKMFWRIIARLLVANPSRLFVILIALGSGAAITAALLNLQVDAKRRLTTEFRSSGSNAIITPHRASQDAAAATVPESLLDQIPEQANGQRVPRAGFLYAPADLITYSNEARSNTETMSGRAVIAGYRSIGGDLASIVPSRLLDGANTVVPNANTCELGEKVASQFHLHVAGDIALKVGDQAAKCVVSQVRSFGGVEDNQIFMSLAMAQELARLPHQVSLIQLSIPGTPAQIEQYVSSLRKQFPGIDVRPIRQFTEGEAKIYNRISGLLTATVLIILLLTFFCVMAAMTNVAMERRNDVGLMKALGGSVRRIVRVFYAEAALLGLTGGIIGSTIGILLSIWLGKAVFGLAARPRLIVYPIAIMLTVIVSLASALPLRRLAGSRPASVFRGEA
jgi:putative ABC transport system permease protein